MPKAPKKFEIIQKKEKKKRTCLYDTYQQRKTFRLTMVYLAAEVCRILG
jgi:hypothetical protein